MGVFKFSPVDFLFTCLGLVFLLFDIVLDIYTVVSFYQEKAYVSLGVLLFFLVGSSVLVQAFSWLWYSYENFERETKVENVPSERQLKLLHVLQLGIYVRHAGVVETSVHSLLSNKDEDPGKDVAVYLSHDLSMLRLIETFSESAPQLVLMLTIILRQRHFDTVTVLKSIGSVSAIACSVTMYHRSLRSFLPDKRQQKMYASAVYFLWNLLLISSRLTALALFASVLPCFIFTHFLCSWVVLFFTAWRAKTDFMEGPAGEWLYRATVGIIWYFDWFNVVKGKTRHSTMIYHLYILADIVLLCSLWIWMQLNVEPPYFDSSHSNAIIVASIVITVYLLGLGLKVVYYKFFHPNVTKEELEGGMVSAEDEPDFGGIETDSPALMNRMAFVAVPFAEPSAPAARCNKRMRKLAENFYC